MSIEWRSVRRVLVIRLRSIGDTVLATPSLIALRRFLPDAGIDILLEDRIAPLLEGSDLADDIIIPENGITGRLRTVRRLRRNEYDVAINLHGGTTATFYTWASGAPHRVGYSHYQYSFLYNYRLSSAADFWKAEKTHSAEQQLALLGFVGVPVHDRPRSGLHLGSSGGRPVTGPFALIHPTAAFHTKQWPAENFARTAEYLAEHGLHTVAVAAKEERETLDRLAAASKVPVTAFSDLSLPEITALASRAAIFVGNDSGIAHIAAAVSTPVVVIFGSSNRDHWRPWTDAPAEIVYNEFACQPCPGHECKVFGDPKCIKTITLAQVTSAIDRILDQNREQ
jgi:ADP-heptose:LPS heptosyltransferase